MSHTETETIQNINDYLSVDAEQDYKTVMLVSTDTQLYEQFLESKFDVMPVYASSIEVAFNYLNQEVRPEVILVDLESSIDGLSSFLYQLKDTTKDSHIPIISIADSILGSEYIKGLNYLLNEQQDKAIDVFIRMLDVITSYSIHYTKLYDRLLSAGGGRRTQYGEPAESG